MLLPRRSTSRKGVTNLHSKMPPDSARIGLHDRHRLVRCAKRNELRGCAARSCHRGSQRAIEEPDVYGRSGRSRQRLLVATGEVRRRRNSPPSAQSPRGRRTAVHVEVLTDVCTQCLHGGPTSPGQSSLWRSGGFLVLLTRNHSAPAVRRITRTSRALGWPGDRTLRAHGTLAPSRRDPGATQCVRGCCWRNARRRTHCSGRRAR